MCILCSDLSSRTLIQPSIPASCFLPLPTITPTRRIGSYCQSPRLTCAILIQAVTCFLEKFLRSLRSSLSSPSLGITSTSPVSLTYPRGLRIGSVLPHFFSYALTFLYRTTLTSSVVTLTLTLPCSLPDCRPMLPSEHPLQPTNRREFRWS